MTIVLGHFRSLPGAAVCAAAVPARRASSPLNKAWTSPDTAPSARPSLPSSASSIRTSKALQKSRHLPSLPSRAAYSRASVLISSNCPRDRPWGRGRRLNFGVQVGQRPRRVATAARARRWSCSLPFMAFSPSSTNLSAFRAGRWAGRHAAANLLELLSRVWSRWKSSSLACQSSNCSASSIYVLHLGAAISASSASRASLLRRTFSISSILSSSSRDVWGRFFFRDWSSFFSNDSGP